MNPYRLSEVKPSAQGRYLVWRGDEWSHWTVRTWFPLEGCFVPERSFEPSEAKFWLPLPPNPEEAEPLSVK